jgi:NAD(P)-dependent dehydrogenase (short-subunit alcohol dehydrogenase family)
MRDLRDKVAVVTGAASGIGRGMAHAFADQGMHVMVADIEETPAEAVAAELRQKQVRSLAFTVDVADAAGLDALAERAYGEFGEVHVLCNNAGVFVGGPVAETAIEEMHWMMSVNFWGVVHGVRAFVPRFRAQDGAAHIVNTGSVSGLFPTPDQGAYTATKYAVVGYSERLREELAEEGIGVSVLCPGGVRTRIGESRRNRPERFGGPVGTTPRPRAATPARAAPSRSLDPLEVGQLVVRGIQEDRLYIHTDPLWVDRYQARFARVVDDFALLEAAT